MILRAKKIFQKFLKGEHASCVDVTEGMHHVSMEYTNNNDDRIRITYEVVQDVPLPEKEV